MQGFLFSRPVPASEIERLDRERRALEEGALNIGQGFPDYPIDPRLAASLAEVIGEGRNQYAPMEGVTELREQISAKLQF